MLLIHPIMEDISFTNMFGLHWLDAAQLCGFSSFLVETWHLRGTRKLFISHQHNTR